jgi:hypothetical protein
MDAKTARPFIEYNKKQLQIKGFVQSRETVNFSIDLKKPRANTRRMNLKISLIDPDTVRRYKGY